jgi:hypothetical protein
VDREIKLKELVNGKQCQKPIPERLIQNLKIAKVRSPKLGVFKPPPFCFGSTF